MNIYNISAQRQVTLENLEHIEEQIQEANGEVTDEQYDTILVLEKQLAISVENVESSFTAYNLIIKSYEGQNAVIDKEIKRLNSMKRVHTNNVIRLKEQIIQALRVFGEKGATGNHKMKLPTLNLFTRITKSVILDDNLEYVDARFHKRMVSTDLSIADAVRVADTLGQDLDSFSQLTVRKTEVGKALKAGEIVTGAFLKEKESLTIR